MIRIFRKFVSLFAWSHVPSCGAWRHYENGITGQRAVCWSGSGYSPVDTTFLRAGDLMYDRYGRKTVVTDTWLTPGLVIDLHAGDEQS